MSKLRKGDQVPFVQVPNKILFDNNLSLKAKGMYAYLLAKPDNWDFAASRITQETKESRDGILSALKELMDYGLLGRKRRFTGQFDYQLYTEPSTENTVMAEPSPEKSTEGKVHGGKSRRLNNKETQQETKNKNKQDFSFSYPGISDDLGFIVS